MEGDSVMAIVITNGTYFISYTENNKMIKNKDIETAYNFPVISDAIKVMIHSTRKTKGYYVLDTFTNHVLWKHMTSEEYEKIKMEKLERVEAKRDNKGKIKRRTYSQDTRKLIYNNAGGCCELCGKKLLFEDMTIDHVIPLSMGGADEVENLSCVCLSDNKFKSNILPDDFMERITEIFMYQMEKKYSYSLKWKIVHKLLVRMV